MEERLVLLCEDNTVLLTMLHQYSSAEPGKYQQGNIRNSKTEFLLEGEAGRSYIDTAIKNKELAALAQLWIKGVTIDWNLLYNANDAMPKRISLPTYPFARERCWVKVGESTLGSSSRAFGRVSVSVMMSRGSPARTPG